MIAAGVAEVKKDTGGGAASASDAKMDGSHKDAARAKSSAKGKAPIPGAKASSKTSMVVEEANDSEEDGEVEEAKAPDPTPPKKMRKESSATRKKSSGKIGSLDVRCRDSNMAVGCTSFQSDNRCSNHCASDHACTGPAQPSEDHAFHLLRVRAQLVLGSR